MSRLGHVPATKYCAIEIWRNASIIKKLPVTMMAAPSRRLLKKYRRASKSVDKLPSKRRPAIFENKQNNQNKRYVMAGPARLNEKNT